MLLFDCSIRFVVLSVLMKNLKLFKLTLNKKTLQALTIERSSNYKAKIKTLLYKKRPDRKKCGRAFNLRAETDNCILGYLVEN